MIDEVRTFFGSELGYVVILFVLFIIPRVLQRWRLPSAITSLALGALGGLGFGLFVHDETIHMLATFGIVNLFLFAGFEVEAALLRKEARVVGVHLGVGLVLLLAATVTLRWLFSLDVKAAVLIGLALLTPSTGFILDSIGRMGLTPGERQAVKSKAIATELLALAVLFFVLQSTSAANLVVATLALAAIVVALPWLFRFFASRIAPYAPGSEFAFLVMMAVLAAYATRRLGAYYLVGAFLVGVLSRRFRQSLPAQTSERLLHAVEAFASFFAPFYFFSAGAALRGGDFSLVGLALGVVFFLLAIPIRLAAVASHRAAALGEPLWQSLRVAVPLLPTLVFTLVLVDVLRETSSVPGFVYGGLIVYALLSTLLPSLVFGTPTPVFDAPELPPETSPRESPEGPGEKPLTPGA